MHAHHTISLLGVPIHVMTSHDTIEHIVSSSLAERGGWTITANLDILRRLVSEPNTRELCSGATLVVADGMPLVWASRLQRTPLPERVTGSDMILSLTRRAAEAGLRVALVGGDINTDGTRIADQAAEKLRAHFPSLQIVCVESPPYGFEKDDEYFRGLAERLVASSPDIIFVAIGFPKQEQLIARLRPTLPNAWFLGIGISFSFVTGDVRRAPRWLQRVGLEWAHRMCQEPGRLAKRYLLHGVPFAIRLLASCTWRGLQRS